MLANNVGTLSQIIHDEIIPLANTKVYLNVKSIEDHRAMRLVLTESALLLDSYGLTRVSPYPIETSKTPLISRTTTRQYCSRPRNMFSIAAYFVSFMAKAKSTSQNSALQPLRTLVNLAIKLSRSRRHSTPLFTGYDRWTSPTTASQV